MREQPRKLGHTSDQGVKLQQDLTGRDRLVSNVLFSWGAHLVFIIAGFVMPRMIDQRLGPELLGIWDFGWSLVSYFSLVQAGLGSSVNRYVARYRMAGDIPRVNLIVSSASSILAVAGLLVLGLTIVMSLMLARFFGVQLGENVLDAQWVVLFLGASMGVQMSFAAFSGVVTGCHRWDVHNFVKSGWHAMTVVGMIVALLQGGSVGSLAVITFVGSSLACLTYVVLAYQVCEGLRPRPSLVRWKAVRELLVFGGKSLIPTVANLLLNQTVNILIVAYLGPSMLALYARPRSLMRHVNMLVSKMAMTLKPTTSSLQSTNDLDGIRRLVIKSVCYALYLVLPMVILVTVFGGPILQLWMGPHYANGLVAAILAVGSLATMSQIPALKILGGLNAHGRAGIAHFVASLCSVGLTILTLGYLRLGLVGTAVAVTLPLAVVSMVYLPLLVCRQVGLPMRGYFLDTMLCPVIHVLPFTICLVGARLMFRKEPLTGLIWGGAAGGAVLAVVYWRYVLPDRIKERVIAGLGRRIAV